MTDKELAEQYALNETDVASLREMINATELAELLGFTIKDKLYLNEDTYYGKIFRFFSAQDMAIFFDPKRIEEYYDCFIRAFKTMQQDSCPGFVIHGKVIWE